MLKFFINKLFYFLLLIACTVVGCKKSEIPIPVKITDSGMDSPIGKITRDIDSYSGYSNIDNATPTVVLEDGRFKIYAAFNYSDSLIFVLNGNESALYKTGYQETSYAIATNGFTYKNTISSSDERGDIVIVDVDRKNKTLSGYYSLIEMNGSNSYNISGQFNKIAYTEKNNSSNTFVYKLDGSSRILYPSITMNGEKIKIEGTANSGEEISILLNGTTRGTYYFTGSSPNWASLYSGNTTYYTDYYGDYNGFFQLNEVDLVNQRISGRFVFFVNNGYSGYSKFITEGVLIKASYTMTTSILN